MKKNNTAEKTIRNAEELTKALKESTEKSLKDIMNEAISNLIKEGEDKETEEDEVKDEPALDNSENSYDVEDVNTENTEDSDETPSEEGEDAAEDAEDADDEWSDLEQYKVGDNDYDFTGVDGETALKVYNKLGDDDQIFVKKDEDGNYEVKDEETGAEYVIELNDDADNAEDDTDSEDAAEDTVEFDFGTDKENPDDDTEFEVELDDETDATPEEGEADDDTLEIEIEGDDDAEDNDDESLNEGQNMVVNDYQKKTAMTLPSDKGEVQGTHTVDAGAPKGDNNSDSTRPYGEQGEGNPFKETVNECGNIPVTDEPANLEEDGQGLNTKHSTKKSTNRINKDAQNQHNVSDVNTAQFMALKENAMKIYNKAKEIQAENKKYEACIEQLKKSIYEAATLNVNMGQVIKLLVNETTTSNEKKSILERFNNVKTIKEGKTLYETIKRELNESKKANVVLEKQISLKSSDTLNETTIYQNKNITNNPALDLMQRMDNLFK